MKIKLIFGMIFISLHCSFVYGAEKDSVILSKNPEINKYLKQPVTPSIPENSVMENPTVKEYRESLVKNQVAVESLPIKIEHTPETMFNDIKPREIYNASPYAKDWSNSGVILHTNGGVLSGTGSYNTMIGMGSMGTAKINYSHSFDNFSLQGGVYGSKLNINGYRFNDFGVSGMFTYNVNEWLALNAYGSYSPNNHHLTPTAMAYTGSTNYGATVTLKANESVGIDLGAERYYDSVSREWRTRPVVAPYVVLWGSKVQMDFGWLLDGLIERNNHNPTIGPPIPPMQTPR